MLPFIFTLLLCFQWVAADDARLDRQPKAATAASPHVLSQLLVKPSPKFALRDTGDSCGTGWRELCFFFHDLVPPLTLESTKIFVQTSPTTVLRTVIIACVYS